jgi:hypothetical protein
MMMNRKNLKKLADYLVNLPEHYKGFDMSVYSDDDEETPYTAVHTCGTVGCAIGHGPYIKGMEAFKGEGWGAYVYRVCGFDEDSIEYDWVFDSGWARSDNTAEGAAMRITMLLESGIPTMFEGISLRHPSIYTDIYEVV